MSDADSEVATPRAGPWKRLALGAGLAALVLVVPVIARRFESLPRSWEDPGSLGAALILSGMIAAGLLSAWLGSLLAGRAVTILLGGVGGALAGCFNPVTLAYGMILGLGGGVLVAFRSLGRWAFFAAGVTVCGIIGMAVFMSLSPFFDEPGRWISAVVVFGCGALQLALVRAYLRRPSDDASRSRWRVTGTLTLIVAIPLAFWMGYYVEWYWRESNLGSKVYIHWMANAGPTNWLPLDVRQLEAPAGTIEDRDLRLMSRMKNLVVLRVAENPLTDEGFAHIGRRLLLTRLDASSTRITDEGLRKLATQTRLQELSLNNTEVTDEGLAHLKPNRWLTHLSLRHTNTTGRCLADLSGNVLLQSLSLDGTGIDDDALRRLSAFPALQNVSLAFTEITDAGVPHLAALPRLYGVNLRATSITDQSLRLLAEGKSPPTALELAYTEVTDRGVLWAGKMLTLQHLDLRGTKVTDECLQSLSRLSLLVQLRLDETRVTAAEMHRLAALPSLDTLWLNASIVDDALPALRQSKSLKTIMAITGAAPAGGRATNRRVTDKLTVTYW